MTSPPIHDKRALPDGAPTHIRSFVHRRSHITPSQQAALEQLLPQWAIDYDKATLDFESVFGRRADTILEIGFGMGETTQKIAQARPHDNFLGVEVFNAGVGALLKLIDETEISNIRIIQHDAVEVVRDMITPASLAGVHIFFPDPWPKKRHHKRRLIQPEFIGLLASRIAPGGYIHCATDWQDYAVQMLDVLGNEPTLKNTVDDYAPRPDYRPLTKFETRGLRLGHGVWDLIFRKTEMNITINGESRQFSGIQTVSDLLVKLDYQNKRLAVELNGDIVPKSQHDSTAINNGDTLEIVVAVGGG